MKRVWKVALASVAMLIAGAAQTHAATLYSQGFETNTAGWTGATRVGSGTNGIPSSSGAFHATVTPGAFTQWGGYNFGGSPTFQEYKTSLDIYLNVGGGFANDTRFDFTSAINNNLGAHRRDFAFNAGFYNDSDITGSGNRFVISASNGTGRANSFPKNPGRDPFAIDDTGWYTFEHHFYDNGSGILAVDLSIFDAADLLLHSWTLSDPSDVIATVIGGNRYGWFPNLELAGGLAIDNAQLSTVEDEVVPEPASMLAWAGLGLCLAGGRKWSKRKLVA